MKIAKQLHKNGQINDFIVLGWSSSKHSAISDDMSNPASCRKEWVITVRTGVKSKQAPEPVECTTVGHTWWLISEEINWLCGRSSSTRCQMTSIYWLAKVRGKPRQRHKDVNSAVYSEASQHCISSQMLWLRQLLLPQQSLGEQANRHSQHRHHTDTNNISGYLQDR